MAKVIKKQSMRRYPLKSQVRVSRALWEMSVCIGHLCLKGLSHIGHFWARHFVIVRPVSLQCNLMNLQSDVWAGQQVPEEGVAGVS